MAARTLTSGEGQRAFDALVRRVERRIDASPARIEGCEPHEVKARIVQQIVELALPGFLKQAYASRPPFPLGVVEAGGLSIDPDSGDVRVGAKLALRCVAQFAAGWVRGLAALWRGMSAPATTMGRVTILFDGGAAFAESDARLAAFCREGPIAPLREAESILIQAPRPPRERTDASISYAPRPVEHLARTHAAARRPAVLAAHLLAPARFLAAVAREPLAVLLGRELAWLPVVRALDAADAIGAMVISTSDFMSQPLWMRGFAGRRFRLHMMWYAQNIVPVQSKEESGPFAFPGFRHMRIDTHWVWTEDFIRYLRSLGQRGDAHAVGPLVWYLRGSRAAAPPREELRIAIFDITPHAPDKLVYGYSRNFYHTARVISAFVNDIVAAARRLEAESGRVVRLLLKHKRVTTRSHHDAGYLDLIDRLTAPGGPVTLVDPNADLFQLIESTSVSVSLPYTSTALISAHVGRPAIYYDPFGDLVPQYDDRESIRFAAGQAALLRTLSQIGAAPLSAATSHP